MNEDNRRSTVFPALCLTAAGVLASFPHLTVRRYRILTRKKIGVPFRLALLSDLHGACYGAGQSELLQQIGSCTT